MAKKIDPKAKAKRQKIYAGIGGVILLAVLAFQVPRTLKMLHPADQSSSSAPAPAATTPATATPIAAPSLAGGNATAAAAAPGGDGLTDPDAVPPPQSGQLLAFGLFRSKDPFAQQLVSTCTTEADPASGTPTSCPSSGATGATGPAPVPTGPTGPSGPSGPPTVKVKQPPAPAQPAPTTAVISVNGSPETVHAGGTFPASDPVFTLVSVTKKGAKISIAGGTLENGAPTVTLTKSKALTLMNTADGTRYVLRLVSVS
jgi:hypothetical protein